MSPRVKRPRTELPKAVVQKGVVGSFPVQAWSLSALYHSRCQSVIGFRDAEETLLHKGKTQIALTLSPRKQVTVASDGKIFNGFSDALYRGQLPEVILVCPPDERRMDFLNDIADYLEQLVAMGFFGNQSDQFAPVALQLPCFVLLGHGVWFSRMMSGLAGFLKDLKYQSPVLSPEMQQAILGRFVRGSAVDFEWNAVQSNEQKANFDLIQLPHHLRIAGGHASSQQSVQAALALSGWQVDIENSTRNAAERLEFQDTAWQLSSVVIPSLAEQKRLSAAEARKLTPLIQQAILAIGCRREAFGQSEKLSKITLKPKSKTPSNNTFSTAANRDVLNGLSAYATALGLEAEKALFEKLASQISSES